MQRLHLQGGFGEKGRTSVLVDDGESRVMLDAGIKVGAPPEDYHPQLAFPANEIDALFITHAHEDHIGALCWLIGKGFDGPVFMTPTTRSEMDATLEKYANTLDLAAHPASKAAIELFQPGDELSVSGQKITTGHTGHVAGGVWFAVQSGGKRTVYCGDVVPESAVFPMSQMPECDMMLLDCSYGDDRTTSSERAERIIEWVAARPDGSVLPTPLSGRSLELLTILPGRLAIADLMYEPLKAQISDPELLRPGAAERIAVRIDSVLRWSPGSALPDCPLLVHDGMGSAGPAALAMEMAEKIGHPVLLSGHLPEGSPGHRMYREGSADWLRLPTHPTLPQNKLLWESAGRPRLIGHSCDARALDAMHSTLPALNTTAATGGSTEI
ncbi:MBL fold metallo-hydrolase [Frigidibacter sp. ROC022]|uniref:MBL fold metallo-hydrolase n=1 Tax=Frigidibacter sp. ROC022 TaxID=2971796 RepID=UPI00215AB858|nr:MBL fold metallo-hydrolase [Frigidibacter sp. ROC022]MCR8722752.1 MBL fold metallo-hydrolase [Frigidibacter sp. ROC022]